MRPQTQDTLNFLTQHAKKLEGKVLFISCQPHVDSQTTDVHAVFGDKIDFDVIGPPCSEKMLINRLPGAFAGYMYGRYPELCTHYGLTDSKEAAEEQRNSLNFASIQAHRKKTMDETSVKALASRGSGVAVTDGLSTGEQQEKTKDGDNSKNDNTSTVLK